jgi:hypothetical protein
VQNQGSSLGEWDDSNPDLFESFVLEQGQAATYDGRIVGEENEPVTGRLKYLAQSAPRFIDDS